MADQKLEGSPELQLGDKVFFTNDFGVEIAGSVIQVDRELVILWEDKLWTYADELESRRQGDPLWRVERSEWDINPAEINDAVYVEAEPAYPPHPGPIGTKEAIYVPERKA